MSKPYYAQSTNEVVQTLHVTEQGLNETDVVSQRRNFGSNEILEGEKKSRLQVLLEQFKDFLVIILLLAAIISAFLGEIESTIVIAVVIFLNAILGTIQHIKAEHSLNSLKEMSAPFAKVLRNGQVSKIPSKEVCVGDILLLEAGDFISADGRILECYSLQINESSLTGESLPIDKISDALDQSDLPIADQKNMVFSGSFVANGRAKIVVTAVGMQTEIGKIAQLLGQAKDKKTPLQVNLDQFGKKLAIAIIFVCLAIFALDIIRGRELIDSFMFAVSLAVAAIPEALSSIVTIVLAFGTQKMAKENAIIRNLHAVESLGSVSVICTDKTGTLTQNQITVQQVFINGEIIPSENLNMENEQHKSFVHMSLLCNDSVTIDEKEIGDPTEIALVHFGELHGMDELITREQFPRIAEVPFDSNRKCMSTVHRIEKEHVMITKGGVDVLLSRITHISSVNGITAITENALANIASVNEQFSSQGLRVLAFGYKLIKDSAITIDDEKDLIFVGLVAMMDPPRPETIEAVAACKEAGIKTVMITGDHLITAAAIAKKIGISQDLTEAIEGKDIEGLNDEELQQLVTGISVYARVSPEHKIRIVRAWQNRGNIVAMTGDGVNDGPALKQANIGVAMGITGTEVAKDASAMVLTDDNFSTIVKAVSNGRSIYHNIQNAIKFLLSGNTGAIFVVLFATIFALPVPFAPVHLLFINLLTDSLPAIAIGLEPHHERVMKEKPRDSRKPILNKHFTRSVLIEGFFIGVVTGTAFWIGLSSEGAMLGSTMAFATLCLSRLLHGFNSRSNESLVKIGVFTNKQSWLAFIVGATLLHLVLFVPGLQGIFEVTILTGAQLGTIYGLAIAPLLVNQGWKLRKNTN